MGKNLIGNNCGLLYEDSKGNLLLISVTPAILRQKDIVEVYHEESWVYGRIEHDQEEYEGYYLFNEEGESNHVNLRTGMKIRIPKQQK